MRRSRLVTLKLTFADVQHCHLRAQQAEACRLLPTATRKQQHFAITQFAKESAWIQPLLSAGRIQVQPGPREQRVGLDQRLPARRYSG